MSWILPVQLRLDDEQASAERLLVAISNHLSLGQWELARVCLRKLVEDDPSTVRAILQSLIYSEDANTFSVSTAIPSSQHLAWLAYSQYVDLGLDGQDGRLHPYTRKWLEFRLLLRSGSVELSPSTLKELCDYHFHVKNQDDSKAETSSTLSNSTLAYLKDVLVADPSLGSELIVELSSSSSSSRDDDNCFLATDRALQRLYIDAASEELLAASLGQNLGQSSERTSTIYKMLALMDPAPNTVEIDAVDSLFADLLQASDSDGVVNKSRVYACLLGRTSPFLITRFCHVEDHLWRSREERVGLGFEVATGDAWKELCMQAIHKGYHVLERLLVVGLDLVRESKFDELAALFVRDEFGPLKPLMLLLGWSRCQSVETAVYLLEALWSKQDAVGNPLIHDACRKLAYQTQLVQWCLEKARPLMTESTAPGEPTLFCQMFEGLESHSVLYVLNRCISMSCLASDDVIELLRKSPLAVTPSPSPAYSRASPSSSTPSTPDIYSHSRPPRRSLSRSVSTTGPNSSEQERDVSIFRSFCAVRYVVDALLFANRKQKGDEDAAAAASDNDYSVNVTMNLKNARNALSHVVPLAYRVEVLENIFSLLFVKTSDLDDPSSKDSDEDQLTPDICEQSGGGGGDSSTASGGLSSFPFRDDFVVDEAVACDVINILKDSLMDLESAKFARHRSSTHRRSLSGGSADDLHASSSAENDETLVRTSIAVADLQQRTARLNQYVNEAKWRFQLVSSSGTRKLLLEGSGVSVAETDSEIEMNEEDVPPPSPEEDETERKLLVSQRRSRAFDERKRWDSGGEGDTEEKNSSSAATALPRRRKRGRRSGSPTTRRAARAMTGRRSFHNKRTGIVSRMLSSPDTLLQLCLRSGNYHRAYEVVHMFGMEGQAAANAVKFSDQLDQLGEQLKGPASRRHSPRTSPMPSRKKKVSFESRFGGGDRSSSPVQMGSSSSTLEAMKELLSSSVTPKHFPFIHNPPDCVVALASSLPSMVLFDLACSSTTIVSVCREFLLMAINRIRDDDDGGGGGSDASEAGPLSFLRRAYDLFLLVKDRALPWLLTQGSGPLDAKSWEKERNVESDKSGYYQSVAAEVKAAEGHDETEIQKADVGHKSPVRQAMESLLEAYTAPKGARGHTSDYIGRFFTHVDNFSSLLISCEEGDGGLNLEKRAANPLAVLKEGPTPTLGKLMFRKQISPYKLEAIARELNLNLVKIIVHCSCPKLISSGRRSASEKPRLYRQLDDSTLIVLNDTFGEANGAESSTSRLDISLLTSLVNFLQVTAKTAKIGVFGPALIDQARSSSQFRALATMTGQLRHFDLKALATAEDLLSFFVNVFNAMMIHAVIEVPIKTAFNPTNLYGSKSVLERLMYMRRIAYRIGALGPVSAFDIYFRLLRSGLPPPSFFGNGLEDLLPELSSDDPLGKISCGQPNPNLLFLLTFGTQSCPFPQVVRSSKLDKLLFPAFRDFLEETVIIDPSSGKVTLPRQLDWFSRDFTYKSSTSDPDTALLQFIQSILSPGKASQLHSLLERSMKRRDDSAGGGATSPFREIHIAYAPFNFEAGFTLPPAFVHGSNMLVPTRRSESSLTIDDGGNDLIFRVRDPLRWWTRVSHSLIDSVSEYLASKSPLLFALASLLRPVASRREETSSSSSLDEFPTLRRFVADRLRFDDDGKVASDEARSVLLLASTDRRTETYVAKLLEAFVYHGNWTKAIDIVDSSIGFRNDGTTSKPLDVFVAGLVNKANAVDCWRYLARLANGDLMASLVLGILDRWPVDVCVASLRLCLDRIGSASAYRKIVLNKLDRMHVYEEALETSDLKWKDLLSDDEKTLRLLLDLKKFDVARKWAKMAHLRLLDVEEDYILNLIEVERDMMKAHMVLGSDIATPDEILNMCQSLLSDRVKSLDGKVFLLEYVLSNFEPRLTDDEKERLKATCMGVKALRCIPSGDRDNYTSLLHRPTWLFEQLLMNQKIEWAGKFLACLQTPDLQREGDVDLQATVVDVKPFDAIVVDYARKSLEFPPAYMTHRLSVVPSTRPPSRTDSPSATPPLRRASSHTFLTKPTSTTSLDRRAFMSNFTSTTSSLLDSVTVSPYSQAKRKALGARPYELPERVPTREEWTKDESVPACMECEERFTMFNRRHHCRRCGRVVCDSCSSYRHRVDTYDGAVRVCKNCYSHLQQGKSLLVESVVTSGGDLPSSGDAFSPPTAVDEDMIEQDIDLEEPWLLPADDEEYCASLRKDFCYPQSPSTTVCLSLLELHSDPHRCAFVILQLCDGLSSRMVRYHGKNEEVDQQLIVSMIQHLLFTAKVKFMKCGDSSGVELCDTYLSKAELLNFLISSDCSSVPSLEDLRRQDAARRLRDKLLLDDRFILAVEVSTKSHLDPNVVWSSWGMACLKAGQYEAAREKFGHCFNRQKDAGQRQVLVNAIVDQIRSTPFITAELVTDPASVTHAIRRPGSVTKLDPARFNECRYYIKAYGSDTMLVEFYVSYKFISKACQIVLDKRCTPSVFVKGVLLPSLSHSCFDKLQEEMLVADSSLEKWEKYLTASCQYLTQKRLFAVLYKLQLFMKDYIRASFTCINFFTGEAGRPSNRLDVYPRLHHLEKALSHLEKYIAEYRGIEPMRSRPGFIQRPKKQPLITGSIYDVADPSEEEQTDSRSGFRLSPSLGDAKRHSHVVRIQIEVTKYLHECGVLAEVAYQTSKGRRDLPATLFGSSNAKSTVASQVLLASQNIENGFKLAFTLIQDFRLNANKIYSYVSRSFAKLRRLRQVEQLLSCVKKSGLNDWRCQEEILMSCINVLAEDKKEMKNAERFIEMLTSDDNKINALIRCQKLKNAYLVAVRGRRVEQVKRIAKLAKDSRQTAIAEICEKFLAKDSEEKLYAGAQY